MWAADRGSPVISGDVNNACMGTHYREYQPKQSLLLPPSLQDWLPEGHLAYFISDTVEEFDLNEFRAKYQESGDGALPYEPALLVKVLLYGYANGVFSSRRIEKKLHEDVAFRVLGANNFPSYRTIARFRLEHGEALQKLFTQVVHIAQEAGLVKLGLIAVDGSKVKANASKHRAMSYGRMKTEDGKLEQEIKDLLKQANAVDAAEDARYGADTRGDEIPEELRRRQDRLAVIQAAKARVEQRHREEQSKDDGSEPPAKKQDNFTDPESRIMKTANGFEQCYNTQIAVEDESRLIVAAEVTQEPNDKKQLLPTMAAVKKECGEYPEETLADSGYRSEEALRGLEKRDITGYVALGREQEETPNISAEYPATARMARRLKGKRGDAKYRKRKSMVEPVFGWIKQALGFRSFLLRGLKNVRNEGRLLCTALNLKRMSSMLAWE